MSDTIDLTAGIWIDMNVGGGFADPTGEGSGSLGCFAQMNDSDKTPVLLGASHVIFPGYQATDGQSVYRGSWSSCCCGGPKVAVAVFDKTQALQSTPGADPYGGYDNGKWYGGFWRAVGPVWEWRGGDRPTKNNNGDIFLTDCAIAKLLKGVTAQNVWRIDPTDPTMDIPLIGIPKEADDTWNGGTGIKPGGVLGQRPDDDAYVRVYSPRGGGQLLWGTMVRFPRKDSVADPPVAPNDFDNMLYLTGLSSKDDAEAGSKPAARQFMILPRPAPSAIGATPDETTANYVASYDGQTALTFDHGDSGTVVINSKGQIIAMIVRGISFELLQDAEAKEIAEINAQDHGNLKPSLDRAAMEFKQVGSFALATPILTVLEQLNITIPDNPKGWSTTGTSHGAIDPAGPFGPFGAIDPGVATGISRARDGLRGSRRGRLVLGLIGRHRREVRRLFETVRAIRAAWRELEGPAYLHHCQRSLAEPDHVVPDRINQVTRRDLINAIAALLARHGSAELRRDLGRHTPWALEQLPLLFRIEEFPDVIARVSR